MPLKLYNSLTHKKEEVFAEDNESVRFYCCGPTVYGPSHIGNFRTFLVQDLFRRVCESTGLRTTHVRNITDIDDKTIRESQNKGEPLVDFTDFWRRRFQEDCERLGMIRPHHEPSALAHIDEQIQLIKILVSKGLAYVAQDKSVYFKIEAFERYGELSGLKKENLKANADGRLNLSDEYDKENFSDFALWKAWKEEDGPNKWDSPWGQGRPGWHIECSAMSMKHLGNSFDMHSGGIDLLFPHHENEIAQSEGATGERFVRHWFHVAHLRVDGEKMSKSLGNLFTIDEVVDRGFTPQELRYVLTSGHYKQPLNFTWEGLSAARSALGKIGRFYEKLSDDGEKSKDDVFDAVYDALYDDLNTSKALGELFSFIAGADPATVRKSDFDRLLWALGISIDDQNNQQKSDVPPEIVELAKKRWEAKLAKDWNTADAARTAVTNAGWTIKDSKDGYEITRS